jgi:hypothetical protein
LPTTSGKDLVLAYFMENIPPSSGYSSFRGTRDRPFGSPAVGPAGGFRGFVPREPASGFLGMPPVFQRRYPGANSGVRTTPSNQHCQSALSKNGVAWQNRQAHSISPKFHIRYIRGQGEEFQGENRLRAVVPVPCGCRAVYRTRPGCP